MRPELERGRPEGEGDAAAAGEGTGRESLVVAGMRRFGLAGRGGQPALMLASRNSEGEMGYARRRGLDGG